MTGDNSYRKQQKPEINQRNRRQRRTETGMTMEQLIRETRKEIYRTQKREPVLNKNPKKNVPNVPLQRQQLNPREMRRYLTSAAVQVDESKLTAHLPHFCNKIPSGNYSVKILVRKNNKISVRMSYKGEHQSQQPDNSNNMCTTLAGP
jgi:hypothetical protein